MMPPQKKYNPDYHDDWGWSLAIKGATDDDIADAFHVSVRTIHRWKFKTDKSGNPILNDKGEKELSTFGKSLETGKEVADAQMERSLFKRGTGYDYKEEERIVEYDKDGSVKPVKIRSITKHIPPDTMAAMYWLNNRSKRTGEWTQRQTVAIESMGDMKGRTIESVLDEMSDEQLKQYEAMCELFNVKAKSDDGDGDET